MVKEVEELLEQEEEVEEKWKEVEELLEQEEEVEV